VKLYVVDASVAAKWTLPGVSEPLAAEAEAILRKFVDGQIRLIVPDFFWVEITNLLWTAVRIGRCSKTNAESSLVALRSHQIPTVSDLPLLDSAFDQAIVYGRGVYDGIYLALAVESAGQLVTADEKLFNAVAGHLPVVWLAAI
jgi:predicted nucleic acid-binding protein